MAIAKVLFLDFDGVLNSEQQVRSEQRYGTYDEAHAMLELGICPLARSNFLYILDCIPDLKIVVHSTRRKRHSLDEFSISTQAPRDRFIGSTDFDIRDKSQAIVAWLKDHPEVVDFLILEDNTIYGFDKKNLLLTNPTNGLTLLDAKTAVEALGGENDKQLYLF